jgi:hypothetical protein
MPRPIRRFLVACLIALHASVTLCGPCLHALPGSGHAAGLAAQGTNKPSPDSSTVPHSAPDHCPICHLFAQSQLGVEVVHLSTERYEGEATPLLQATLRSLSTALPSRPRAPPAFNFIHLA